MTQLVLAIAIMFCLLLSACDRERKLMPNTEEYLKAHGVVKGQSNEIRIGSALFRFPAGLGLNPFTSVGNGGVAVGGGQISLQKTSKKIVKGLADSVQFSLSAERPFKPLADWFGFIEGPHPTILITITKNEIKKNTTIPDIKFMESHWNHKDIYGLSLREYIPSESSKLVNETNVLIFRALNKETPNREYLVFKCAARYDAKVGFVREPARCATAYQSLQNYSVSYVFSGELLSNWQEIHKAVSDFIDSIATE